MVSSSKRKEQEEKMKLNELIRAKSKWTSILFVARFIGGFSGAKGWNQGYGYGQSGGYYGTNYDGSSKVHFVFFLHKNHFTVAFQLIAHHITINNLFVLFSLSLSSTLFLSRVAHILGYAGYADYYSGGYGPSGYGAGYQDYYSGNYGKPHYKSNNYHYNNHHQ